MNEFLNTRRTPAFLDLPENVPTTAQFATLSIPQIEAQQKAQRQQLLNAGVRGGSLNQALGSAAINSGLQRTQNLQAFSIDDLMRQDARDVQRAGLRQSLFGAASDLGTGGVTQAQQGFGQSMAGLGNAASNLNVLGGQRIGQNMQTQGALGNLAGKGLGYSAGQMLPGYSQNSLGAQKAGARPMMSGIGSTSVNTPAVMPQSSQPLVGGK